MCHEPRHRFYDPQIGRWFVVDPLASSFQWQTPYCAMDNDPINKNDPTGMATSKPYGDYYTWYGSYVGSDGKNDNKVYVTDVTNPNQMTNATELSMTHSKFLKEAATVYGESSAFKYPFNDANNANGISISLSAEMSAIASVHKNNGNAAYGGSSAMAKSFLKASSLEQGTGNMGLAIAAVINANTGGADYSGGANLWDGIEHAGFGDADKRFSTGNWELHKNTIGWKIENNHYASWGSFAATNGFKFEAPQLSFTPIVKEKHNKYFEPGTIKLQSTAQYLGTIFWRELKGSAIIKAPAPVKAP